MARVKTGITDLDQMLDGGFMEGDAVMVAGSAGTGKSTLALQYLVNGIRESGDNGIYVTFEELPDRIYRDAENFGWDLKKMEEENKLRVVCTSPNILLESGEGEHILDEPIKAVQPRRIVIDSLSHLEMFVPKHELRKEAYRLIMYLKTRRLSPLLIWESPQIMGQSLMITDVGLSFLVDCLIFLKFVEIRSSMRRVLGVLKLRGSNHDRRLMEYEIASGGIKVGSPFLGYEGITAGTTRRISESVEDVIKKIDVILPERPGPEKEGSKEKGGPQGW